MWHKFFNVPLAKSVHTGKAGRGNLRLHRCCWGQWEHSFKVVDLKVEHPFKWTEANLYITSYPLNVPEHGVDVWGLKKKKKKKHISRWQRFSSLSTCLVPGLVPEPKSQVPQKRESHAGQQKCLPPQVLLRRSDGSGAAHRAAPCTSPERLPILGQCCPLQVLPLILFALSSTWSLLRLHLLRQHFKQKYIKDLMV